MPDLSHSSLESALATCAVVAFVGWACWALLALAVALVDRRLAARIGPPLLRGLLVAGTCAATAVPAHATGTDPGRLDGLRLPDRTSTGSITPVADPPRPVEPDVHVVAPGDCLWSIVRARLPDAGDAEVSRQVARWFATNRDVIGADPDLLQPGQELVPPQEHHDHRHGPRHDALRPAAGAAAVPGAGTAAPGAGGTG